MSTPDISGAYAWAIRKCNEANIGYSQQYRNEQTVNGITYYDCSSFIWYALLHNGFDCVAANWGSTWPFTTRSMPEVLQSLGYVQIDQNTLWKPMDIVLTPGTHTELVYTGGSSQGITMGAHTDGIPLADQVSINTGYTVAGNYSQLWRYKDGQVEGYYCWMGWIPNESIYNYLDPNGLAVNGDRGRAYGMYQFDYQGGLVPFMQSCVNYDPNYYSGFNTYIAMGVGNTNLIANSGLIILFQKYANERTAEFQYLQDKDAVEEYLIPAINYVSTNYGYDITKRDPTILGSLFSMAIREGLPGGAQCFANGANLYDEQLIYSAYNAMSKIHYDDGRWITGTPNSQLDKCLLAYQNKTDFYIVPYGGYTPTPVPVITKSPIRLWGKNIYYRQKFLGRRF